jgi:molybdopterin converting factor subunit 1
MRVHIRLFAVLKERAGTEELELELDNGASVADALQCLRWLTDGTSVVMAVNQEYANPQTPLFADDELALIPPVSGGIDVPAAIVHVRVTGEPLSIDSLTELVSDPRAGAIVTFTGVTREIPALQYEAYVEMAQRKLAQIANAAVTRHGLCAAAVEHRIGEVALSEPSVLVAVSAPHRGEAFAGAREIIDTLKAQAPIWKRDDRAWVQGMVPGESKASSPSAGDSADR